MRRTFDNLSPQNLHFTGMSHITKLDLITPAYVEICIMSDFDCNHRAPALFIEILLVMMQIAGTWTPNILLSESSPATPYLLFLFAYHFYKWTATRIIPQDIWRKTWKIAMVLHIATLSLFMALWKKKTPKNPYGIFQQS